jgi:flagellar hook protein FlgE
MASTTALFTGLSGMNANSRHIDVIGNNIANVNTTAYKSNRLLFSTMFSRTMSMGSAPSTVTGGTNPFQIGFGVQIAGTQRNMIGGSVSATGDARDMAIDGAGFFIVNRGGAQFYTRAGAFRQNQANQLVDIAGNKLQGFGVDANFNIIPGRLVDLTVPIGSLTLAEATRNVRFSGNLNADGTLPSTGSQLLMGALRTISTAAPAPTAPNLLEPTTRLVDIEDPAQPGSDVPIFTVGQRFEIRGAEKGGREVPTASFEITATTTVQDIQNFLVQALGIDTTSGPNPDGSIPGVELDPLTGTLTITGNIGTANDLSIDSTDLRIVDGAGALVGTPFTMNKVTSADGESVRTTFIAYDSLGSPVEIEITLVLESKGTSGTTWRYYIESNDDSDPALQVATGTISFDTEGQPISDAPISITLDRTGSGSATPMSINLSFAGNGTGGVTSLSDSTSSLAATSRDGAPIGTLSGYAVGVDGVITGVFTNGLTRTIGQVALATFSNPEGLVDAGNSLFSTGANSGEPVIAAPGTFGAGYTIGGALELSNVDLGEEFIKLILSSTGYSASSRVIRTADDLMQQLLALGR